MSTRRKIALALAVVIGALGSGLFTGEAFAVRCPANVLCQPIETASEGTGI